MTGDPRVQVSFGVNGTALDLEVAPGETLLQTLRDRLGLTGTKEGCVEGECGACTVLVDGKPVDSCITASAALDGREVRTVEGLATEGELAPLQKAFVEFGAVQCGFCTPGFLMTLTALLEENAHPTSAEIKESLAGNLCRCTGYRQMLDAVGAVVDAGGLE